MLATIRKNNKKILAVLGVFLMIAFIVPSVAKRPGGFSGASLGKMGDERLRREEWDQARYDREMLSKYLLVQRQMPLMQYEFFARLQPPQFANNQEATENAFMMSRQLADHLEPLDLLLLLKEAQRMQVRVSPELVQAEMKEFTTLTADQRPGAEAAIGDWLRILAAFDRVAGAASISPALVTHMLAQTEEQVALEMVEFSADTYKSQVPAPTDQQLQAFFDKYRAVDSDTSDTGFGYRYPNRVRFQYIKVPVDQIKTPQRITMEDIYKFYKDHPNAFPTTQAAETQPATTRSAALPATEPIASREPTTRPWEALTSKDYDQIRDAIAETRATAMIKAIQQIFQNDWPMFRQAARDAGTTLPAKPPVTLLGVPYNDLKYLQQAANQIQGQKESQKVLPEAGEVGELKSIRQLSELPGIGHAGLFDRPVGFPQYAITWTDAFMTDQQRKQATEGRLPPLALYQPSQPVRDPEGNYYIFRIVEAEAAHTPSTIGPLAQQVKDDYVTAEAYRLAKDAAAEFLKKAQPAGLEIAAKSSGDLKVVKTGLFTRQQAPALETYKVPQRAAAKFVEGSFALLQERLKTDQEHPMGLVDLPRAARTLVARLADAKPSTEHEFLPVIVGFRQQELERLRVTDMLFKWFQPEAIRARTKYVPEAPSGNTSKEQPEAPEEPQPIF